MTTLTQHSPSLSSPVPRNESNDYFSISKNDILDVQMSATNTMSNGDNVGSKNIDSTLLENSSKKINSTFLENSSSNSSSYIPVPKKPKQNFQSDVDNSSVFLGKSKPLSLSLDDLSITDASLVGDSSNERIPSSNNTVQFDPAAVTPNMSQMKTPMPISSNPFESQFFSDSCSDANIDAKMKKLHNLKKLKVLSSSSKADATFHQQNRNINMNNSIRSSTNLQNSKNSSNMSIHRSSSTSRKIVSSQSAVGTPSSSAASSSSLASRSATKSPIYHHAHIQSPTYQTTATANTKLPAYLMATAGSSNHNYIPNSTPFNGQNSSGSSTSHSSGSVGSVSHRIVSPVSPSMTYNPQSSMSTSLGSSISPASPNSTAANAASKALNSNSTISNPSHLHPQSSTLNAVAAVAASSAGSKSKFSAYAQSLHQNKYNNRASNSIDYNSASKGKDNRMSVMSTSSDIVGYRSQNYYKYHNHYLKNSINGSIDEDNLEDDSKSSALPSSNLVNKPSKHVTDSNQKHASLSTSLPNNAIYRSRTANLSVSSLPSFNFNSTSYQRKLSGLANANTGSATKAYQKVILRKHQKLNQNNNDMASNFKFGPHSNSSVVNGLTASEDTFELPENVYGISADTLNSCLFNNTYEGIHLIAVVDIRTFNEYAKKRINKSVNISLPTTLLKRKNYTLSRTISQLSDAEKHVFLPYVASPEEELNLGGAAITDETASIPSVVLYDSCTTEKENKESEFLVNFNLYYMGVKFARGWKGRTYILNGGINTFSDKFPTMIISPTGAGSHSRSNSSVKTDQSSNFKSNDTNSIDLNLSGSLTNHSDLNLTSSTSGYSHFNNNSSDFDATFSNDNNLDMIHKIHDDLNSQRSDDDARSISSVNSGFSGFELPSAKYFFRVRQNDELVNVSQCVKHLRLKNAAKIPAGFQFEMGEEDKEYPLNASDENSENDPRINCIVRKFKQLEIDEKTRINDNVVKFYGIEMGLKNRYKDILPFDYNRVLLKNMESNSADATPTYERGFGFDFNMNVYNDYVNASNITVDLSKYSSQRNNTYKCIASQAPLKNSVDDFIRMVEQNNIAVIVTLTDCMENMVEKCFEYWNCKSSQFNISVDESFDTGADLEIKLLKIERNDAEIANNRYVLQLHLHNWADLSDFNNFIELIKIIKLKNYILSQVNSNKNLDFDDEAGWLVHCSAGCGRTGTFIAIDVLLQIFPDLIRNRKINEVVFNVVNDLREQRVSMVQTTRQYLMIYDSLIENMSLENGEDEVAAKFIHEWDSIPIIQHYLERQRV